MQYRNITRILGLLVALLSVTMLPPIFISFIYRDGGGLAFILSFFVIIASLGFFNFAILFVTWSVATL